MSSSVAVFRLTGYEDVLLQAIGFRLPDVLADLLVELGPRFPRAVLGKLARHAFPGAGNQQDLLWRAGIEVHVDEGLAVQLRQLCRRQRLTREERVQLDDARKGTLLQQSFHDGRRHVRQREEILFRGGVRIDNGALSDLRAGRRTMAKSKYHQGGGNS